MLILVFLLGLGIGAMLAITVADLPHAYHASLAVGFVWMLVLISTGIGVLLCIPRSTRLSGAVVIITGLFFVGSFHGTLWTLREIGRVKSKSPEPIVNLGPTGKVNLLIYFRSGISGTDYQAFLDRVIYVPQQRGKSLRKGLRLFLTIEPVQGHAGVALDFDSSATTEERREIIAEVLSDSRVYRILTDTVPAEVVNLD